MIEKSYVVACIPAFNEERNIGGVVIRAMKHADKVVVCVGGSGDLTGAIAETGCFLWVKSYKTL